MKEKYCLDLEGTKYILNKLSSLFFHKKEGDLLADRISALEEENAALKLRIQNLESHHTDDIVYVAYKENSNTEEGV